MIQQKSGNFLTRTEVYRIARLVQACTYGDQREVITPIFQHKVTSMLQVKDEQSGSFNGNNGKYELLWDDEKEKYILTEMQIAQTSLF